MKIKRHTIIYIPNNHNPQEYVDALTKMWGLPDNVTVEYCTSELLSDAVYRKIDFIVSTGQPSVLHKSFLSVPGWIYYRKVVCTEVVNFELDDRDLWISTILPPCKKWIVIGDLHGCVDELKLLLNHYGIAVEGDDKVRLPNDTGILFVGDLIDKGVKTRETIEFLRTNLSHFHFIRGNHDEFVYKYLTKGDNFCSNKEIIAHHDSIPFFQKPENFDVKEKFFELYPYLQEFAECGVFIATHSPCFYNELGMMDPSALALQRKMYLDPEKSLAVQMQCIENDPFEGHKYHIFGHIPFDPYHFEGNKIGIDSGCIHGNALGSVLVDCENNDPPTFYTEKFLGLQPIYPEEIISRSSKNESRI